MQKYDIIKWIVFLCKTKTIDMIFLILIEKENGDLCRNYITKIK